MSEDERPGDEHGQDELIAAFAALGGRLTGEEFMRLLGPTAVPSGWPGSCWLVTPLRPTMWRGARWLPCSRHGAGW
jgi:hypothetical protein